jgi:hypothetical protein
MPACARAGAPYRNAEPKPGSGVFSHRAASRAAARARGASPLPGRAPRLLGLTTSLVSERFGQPRLQAGEDAANAAANDPSALLWSGGPKTFSTGTRPPFVRRVRRGRSRAQVEELAVAFVVERGLFRGVRVSGGYQAASAHRLRCPDPLCKGSLHRIKRRLADRILSLVTPVRRYQCSSCGWEGNLRQKRVAARSASDPVHTKS